MIRPSKLISRVTIATCLQLCALGLYGAAFGSGSHVRTQADTVGYATRPDQVEAVVALADSLEAERYASNAARFTRMSKEVMIGAVCPHDDYLYAARVYVHVMREVRAPLAVLFGVSHAARRRKIQDVLIFDTHRAWAGPYGECPVSPIREQVISGLPADMVLVSDEIHAEEHSLEAFIPFLQYYGAHPRGGSAAGRAGNRGIEILPVLVTRFNGELFTDAVDTVAAVLSGVFRSQGWELGRDVVVLVSADCVHYGDEGWGGRNYAPFGVDSAGYERGVAQDLGIIETALTGTLDRSRISLFRENVERDDFQWPYKVTWCGVYSIPFGLSVLVRLTELLGRGLPEGCLLGYGTSLEPGRLPLDHTGLGVTNVNTLRHWVGYAAIGYW